MENATTITRPTLTCLAKIWTTYLRQFQWQHTYIRQLSYSLPFLQKKTSADILRISFTKQKIKYKTEYDNIHVIINNDLTGHSIAGKFLDVSFFDASFGEKVYNEFSKLIAENKSTKINCNDCINYYNYKITGICETFFKKKIDDKEYHRKHSKSKS